MYYVLQHNICIRKFRNRKLNGVVTGQRAQPNWKDLSAPILMAKDISGELPSRILVDPEDFTEIWRDQGGTGDMDVAFWKAKCPEGEGRIVGTRRKRATCNYAI